MCFDIEKQKFDFLIRLRTGVLSKDGIKLVTQRSATEFIRNFYLIL